MKKSIILLFIFFAFIQITSHAQKAKIFTSTQEITTVINGYSKTSLFTESGTISISDIQKLIFEKKDEDSSYLYDKLSGIVAMEFGDGSDMGSLTVLYENPEEKVSVQIQEGPDSGDYLVKASRSGLISIGLGIVTGVAIVVSGGSAAPVIGAVGGLGSFGFLVDAWSKIGKAGKARKKEQEASKVQNQ
ncbi:hypothetical protein KUV23_06080 [Algoriphagus marincola]|uniref:Uncharacterized protein n=1 Tax=Algoriphagus marincola TaxID=264027 RepID=A0ABS7N2I6_9BACT|nr:hypothetical protein [Algoriphagus marincola]MBY5950532.1 hypothetical protein [Algoriphagus marincola]